MQYCIIRWLKPEGKIFLKTIIKNLLSAESTYVDFKVSIEKSKPKSWLKTVVAFSNGLGGTILFGVDDCRNVVGLENVHSDSEKISELIKAKIDPMLMFELWPVEIDGKQILMMNIPPGKMTPYYYVNEGSRIAFVRIGNESVTAPSHIIHELILKGQRLSFDALSTEDKFDDASFTLFKSLYHKANRQRIEGKKDYLSFGMIDKDGNLTNAGLLLADECNMFQSRVFCTKWVGNGKGKKSFDASDDKEYRGNIIMLLKESLSFIKSNSKKAWKIDGINRIEVIDYPEDAVREAVVNALVHRDYGIVGSEVHIDMYDDRLEIVSPGGMYDGKNIQEVGIDEVASIRRNPVLADILNRLDYMERRGSGLQRIVKAFEDKKRIEFYSNHSKFTVLMRKQDFSTIGNERYMSDNERYMSELNNNEQKIVGYLLNNSKIANKKVVELTGLSQAQSRRVLVALAEKEIIEAHGAKRGRYYTLIKR